MEKLVLTPCGWAFVIDTGLPFSRFDGTRKTHASPHNHFLYATPVQLYIRVLKIFSTSFCFIMVMVCL